VVSWLVWLIKETVKEYFHTMVMDISTLRWSCTKIYLLVKLNVSQSWRNT